MKAIEINGQIKQYSKLPHSWGNVLGGFDLLSDEQLKSYGFYDIDIPEHDGRVEQAGDLYFNSETETFTKDISNKTWDETLSELKAIQINNYKSQINLQLSVTDWYIVRNQETGAAIPDDISTARQALRDQADLVETEINALTTKKAVMSYDFPIVE
jgi:hypothetical protein